MKAAKIIPVDAPRDFAAHELFFSTTDRKGIIRSGNDVFVRVSGYPEAALVGQPHNLIRHPDMPRAVFRLVWEHLLQGRAVAGYIKNMAADGRHYWVVAIITPLREGFLSVRFKPTGRLFATIQSLYADMRRIETEAAQRGESGPVAMDQAAAHLQASLQQAGFADYDTFMAAMVRDELGSRDAAIAASGRTLLPEHLAADDQRLEAIHQQCLSAYRELNTLHAGLADYLALGNQLHDGFTRVTNLTGGIRLVALNATIKAAQLGEQGRCTAVVADFLGGTSGDIDSVCAGFARQLQPVATGLQSVSFNLAAARLQLEMILVFTQELARLGQLDESHGGNLDVLQTAFDGTSGPAVQALQAVEAAMHGFRGHSDAFSKLTLNLQVAQIVGAVEASRLARDHDLNQTFGDLRQQTDGCRLETDRLDEVFSRLDVLAAASPAMIRQITATIQSTRRSVKEFVSILDEAAPPVTSLVAPPLPASPRPPAGKTVSPPSFAVVS